MENSKNFIFEKLNILVNTFPELEIRYKHEEFSKTHLIEVKPCIIYKNNGDYMKIESSIDSEFNVYFPDELLIFISDDSLITIDTEDLTFKKDSFGCYIDQTVNENNIIVEYQISDEDNVFLAA